MLKLVHDSHQNPAPRTNARRVLALALALWDAEIRQSRMLAAWPSGASNARTVARLAVLAATHRAHASRLLARVCALGQGPRPVVDDTPALFSLSECAAMARTLASRCEALSEAAREAGDLSTAWVGENNRTENQDSFRELAMLAEAE